MTEKTLPDPHGPSETPQTASNREMDAPAQPTLDPGTGADREISDPDPSATAQAAESAGVRATAIFNDLLRAASRQCRRLVDSPRARIWIVRRAGRRLVAFDFPDDEARPPIEIRRGGDEGPAGWAIKHGRPLRVEPGGERPLLKGDVEPFEAALVFPLFRRGEAFAAVECLDKCEGGAFSDDDYERLEAAAEQLALSLDNAMLYQATERRSLEKDLLLEISRTLSAPLDLEEVIAEILKAVRQVVNYEAASIYLMDRKTKRLAMVHEIGHPEGSEEIFQLRMGQGIVGWVAKTGRPVIVPDVHADDRYVEARATTRSELAVPLTYEGRTIGVFNLECDLDDAYHEGHMAIVSGVAAQAAVAIERARLTRELLERRRLEKELAIARDIQLSFLPKAAPEIPGFELAGTALPHAEVGGDYFDFIKISENRLGVAIADVSGKGIPAALIMAGFRMSLLAEIRNEFAIRAIMRKVNSLLHESIERHQFVTAFYGVLDYRNRVLIFSNAGHNPPILWRKDGGQEYLVEGGVALGVLPGAFYEERPVAVRPGDVLVLYTDGVSEAESETGDQFGRERIEQSLARRVGRSAQDIVDGIVRDVREWSGTRGQTDDLTLMVVKALER